MSRPSALLVKLPRATLLVAAVPANTSGLRIVRAAMLSEAMVTPLPVNVSGPVPMALEVMAPTLPTGAVPMSSVPAVIVVPPV